MQVHPRRTGREQRGRSPGLQLLEAVAGGQMGLLDRVKQNQTVPPAGPTGNGPPATATLPGAATTYASASTAPPAQTAAAAAPAAGLQRGPGGRGLSPAFAPGHVPNHSKLVDRAEER